MNIVGHKTQLHACCLYTGHKLEKTDDGTSELIRLKSHVGTRAQILPGSMVWAGDTLPDRCMLGAISKMVSGDAHEEGTELQGVPAALMPGSALLE